MITTDATTMYRPAHRIAPTRRPWGGSASWFTGVIIVVANPPRAVRLAVGERR